MGWGRAGGPGDHSRDPRRSRLDPPSAQRSTCLARSWKPSLKGGRPGQLAPRAARARSGPRNDRLMLFLLRLLLAQTLFHQFEGLTFDSWARLLRRERFRIYPICWPRALWITAMSLVNSAAARAVRPAIRGRDRDSPRRGAGLHPRALPERHHLPSRADGQRPEVCLAEPLPDLQPQDLPRSPSRGWPHWSSRSCCPAGSRKTRSRTWS